MVGTNVQKHARLQRRYLYNSICLAQLRYQILSQSTARCALESSSADKCEIGKTKQFTTAWEI